MEKNRVILRNFFEQTAPSQFTMYFPLQEEIDYGIDNIVIEFSDNATKTINVIINFLFAVTADTFYQNQNLLIAGDLLIDNIPVNVGAVINMDYVFDTEENFISFVSNFYADQVVQIIDK